MAKSSHKFNHSTYNKKDDYLLHKNSLSRNVKGFNKDRFYDGGSAERKRWDELEQQRLKSQVQDEEYEKEQDSWWHSLTKEIRKQLTRTMR